MKPICITLTFLFWMIFTIILTLSVVGWVVILPKANYTGYDKPQEDLRSTWMRIGYSLFEKIKEF